MGPACPGSTAMSLWLIPPSPAGSGSGTRMELLGWFLPRRKHMAVYFSDNCGSSLFLFKTKLFSLLTYELFKPALWPFGLAQPNPPECAAHHGQEFPEMVWAWGFWESQKAWAGRPGERGRRALVQGTGPPCRMRPRCKSLLSHQEASFPALTQKSLFPHPSQPEEVC